MGNDGRHTPDATHGSSAPWSAPGDALTAAEQDRIYEAALDAVMVRQLAIWLSGSQVVSILPIVGIVGLAGYFVLLAAVPGMALRWFLRHGRLDSRNPDIVTARRRLALAMVVWMILGTLTLAVMAGCMEFASSVQAPVLGATSARTIGHSG